MAKSKGILDAWRAAAEILACERTLDEQIEWIECYGNHAASPALRSGTLAALGFDKPKESAQICLIFGCYRPFTTPVLMGAYLQLLTHLKIDYTYLEQEYCCGAPLSMLATQEQTDGMLDTGEMFMERNLEAARLKGASTLAYCCAGCANAANHVFQESDLRHIYLPELIIESLPKQGESIDPIKIGYFGGCRTIFTKLYPQAKLDWQLYRKFLDTIDGLHVIDLPNGCCKKSAAAVVEKAVSQNLDAIVCPCNWCWAGLMPAAKGKIRGMNIAELLCLACISTS